MIVWKKSYRPFILGGDVNAMLGVEVQVGEKFDLGGGYEGYLIANPFTGETRVAEATTGAIVADTLEQAREDVKTGDPEVMAEQLALAAKVVADKKIDVVSAEDFWSK
jgi:hypothetical protein